MEAGATFITKEWIATKLKRNKVFVKKWWRKDYSDIESCFKGGRPPAVTPRTGEVILQSTGKKRKGVRKVSSDVKRLKGKTVSKSVVHRYLTDQGYKPYHIIAKPMKSVTNIEDRLWFCGFLRDWDEEDFLHLVPSDEFFIYCVRKPNRKNDIVWALKRDDIADLLEKAVPTHPLCIGLFLMFSAKRLIGVIKEDGQTWNGAYFRDTIIRHHILPFMKNEDCVIDINSATFLHDRAPCYKAAETQELMRSSGIDFFSFSEYPGNSPDLNTTENMGSIVKDRVDALLDREPEDRRYTKDTLKKCIKKTIRELNQTTELFEALLKSYPARLAAVQRANGGHTKY